MSESMMNTLMWVFFLAFVASLILAGLTFREPEKYAFICKVRNRRNGVMAWVALAALFALGVTWAAPKDQYGNVIVPPREEAVQPEAVAPAPDGQ